MNTTKKTVGKVEVIFSKRFVEKDTLSQSAADTLRELFSLPAEQIPESRRDMLQTCEDAEVFYSLSPKRGSLVSWYPFGSNKKILEIDSGTGAVTEALAATGNDVLALATNKEASAINALRNKENSNVSVLCGELSELEKKSYDYIICSDASNYSDGLDVFLGDLLPYLKKDGAILFGISNKIGLRYWAGSREEGTNLLFESLEGFPNSKTKTSLSKKEIAEQVEQLGVKDWSILYPFPDHFTPHMVYTDDYYPGNGASIPLEFLPYEKFGQPREYLLSEQAAMGTIEASGLFPEFTNSFLVEVQP